MSTLKVSTTKASWFFRGFLAGILLMGSLNAISFFVRTGGWGSLLEGFGAGKEAIGFPFELWSSGNNYGGLLVNLTGLLLNTSMTIAISSVLGLVTLTQIGWLNRMVADIESRAEESSERKFQFSLRGLLLATVFVAMLAAMARPFSARSEFLAGIYLFGPAALVILAILPRGVSWQQRVAIMTPAAFVLITAAMGIGSALDVEFDKVLMGIFVCWVPQSALAALGITLGILAIYYRRFAIAAKDSS